MKWWLQFVYLAGFIFSAIPIIVIATRFFLGKLKPVDALPAVSILFSCALFSICMMKILGLELKLDDFISRAQDTGAIQTSVGKDKKDGVDGPGHERR